MKLSVCMMVKDEEELLPQCLESIQKICDELIIVDTGSKDKSIDIATAFGAKIYHHPWINNFSHHRNQSIKYSTGDWILIIDADEKLIIDPNLTKEDINEWFENTPEDVNSIAVMVQDIQDGKMMMCCNSARIFRKGKIHYEGVVHNQPMFTGPCGLCHFMYLEHYGYGLSKEKMEVKFKRSEKLLLDRYKKNKKDYQVGFYMCQLYGQNGDIDDSILWGERYLANKDKMGKDFNASIYFTMVRNYQGLNDIENSYRVLRMGLREDPTNPDLGLALSDQGTFTGEPHIVAEGARRFLKGYKKCMDEPNTMEGKFYFTLRADAMCLMIYRLCISCFQEGMDAWSLFQENKQAADADMMVEFKSNLGSLGMYHLREELFGKEDNKMAKDKDDKKKKKNGSFVKDDKDKDDKKKKKKKSDSK